MTAGLAVASAQQVDLLALAPPLVTAVGALLVLVVDLLRPPASRSTPFVGWVAGGVVAVAAVPLGVLTAGSPRRTFCQDGGQLCSYDTAAPTLPLQWLVLAAGLLVVVLGAGEVLRRGLPSGEYHFLLLASITGSLVLVAARDLATAVVALETVTLPLVILVALGRQRRGAQAALSLYLSSVVSLAVALYGVALLYSATGTLYYPGLAAALPETDGPTRSVAAVGAMLVLAVFVFKVAAVPFQAWAPDAYAAAPVPVAAYLSVVSKTAGVGGLVVLLGAGLLPVAGAWGAALGVVVVATFVVGNVLALRQGSFVRLLAWSSVAQLAYVLLPLAALGAGASGPVRAEDQAAAADAVSAAVAYLAAYAAMTLACWAVVMVVVARLRPADGVLMVADLRGLARTSPWIGGALAFALACLAGLPPGIVGLVVKVRVFQSAVAAQSWLLVGVAVVATVVGLVYYLRVGQVLLAAPERLPARPVLVGATGMAGGAGEPVGVTVEGAEPEPGPAPLGAGVVAAVATAALVVTSVAPALLLGWL